MFDRDYRFAELDKIGTVEFTHAESQVLAVLAGAAGRVMTREQILGATDGDGSISGDRNVDHLINRIRKKLGDNPKNPKFIGTRYGGGYYWIGKPTVLPTDRQTSKARVVIGPVRGLELIREAAADADDFMRALSGTMSEQISGDDDSVVVLEDYHPQNHPIPDLKKQIELTFFDNFGKPEAVISCKSATTGALGFAGRISLRAVRNGNLCVPTLAKDILKERWHRDVQISAAHEHLPIAMIEASLEKRTSSDAWLEQASKVDALVDDNPDDIGVKIIKATHMYSGHVALAWKWFREGDFHCQDELRQIEELTLPAIGVSDMKPEMAIMVAKLLHYADPAYLGIALDIARKAHAQSQNVATTLTIMGQLETFAGNFDAGLACLKQAEAVAPKGSRLKVYVLTLQCQTLIAAGRRDEIGPAKAEILRTFPAARFIYEPFLTDPNKPSLFAKGLMLSMTRKSAASFLHYFQLLIGRLFADPAHAATAMHAPLALFERRFGTEAIPQELRATNLLAKSLSKRG